MKATLRRRLMCLALAAAACVGLATPSARAATPEQVDAAIKKGVAYLYSQRKGDHWEIADKFPQGEKARHQVSGWQWGGTTGCAVYGLLACGEKPGNEKMQKSIEWLKTADIHGHYAAAMRAQAWPYLPTGLSNQASRTDYKILLNGLIVDKANAAGTGFYSYYTDLQGKIEAPWYDRSVGQIGVLGMWACDQAGQEVPMDYWRVVDAAWKKAQQPDGGWNYRDGSPVSGTMTAAGIATLFITQDYLTQQSQWSVCRGGSRNQWIEKGLSWMDKNAPKLLVDAPHYFYQMYGIERIGVASGRKYFGTTDWYQVGAESLVKKQNPDGSWGANDAGHNPKKVPDTVFALLFLTRGRAPVVMNKLEYDIDGLDLKKNPAGVDVWNQRPRDAANFTHWASRKTEQFLNWQVVNLKVSANDLHDAPILYMAGSLPLNFSDEEVNKLRHFVEGGGLILGNADCANPNFAKSFIALGNKLFPKYEFRELTKTHPIYDQVYKPNRWKMQPKLLGMSNEARELMLLFPEADAGRFWQTRAESMRPEAFELMLDIFMYSVDKSGLRTRGDSWIVNRNTKVTDDKQMNVARLMVGENPNPEPGGWRRVSNVVHNAHKIGLKLESVKPGEGKLDPSHFQLAHLTGTTKLALTDAARDEIKKFVQGGGTLLVDAAGGSSEFADAVESELAKTFNVDPKNLGVVLPPDHPLYSNSKIDRVTFRLFAQARLSGKLSVPRLRAILVEGRPAVLYSREDLSVGMVGQPIDGILGYSPESATELTRAVVAYVAGKAGSNIAKANTDDAKPAAGKVPAAKPAPAKPAPKPAPKKK